MVLEKCTFSDRNVKLPKCLPTESDLGKETEMVFKSWAGMQFRCVVWDVDSTSECSRWLKAVLPEPASYLLM